MEKNARVDESRGHPNLPRVSQSVWGPIPQKHRRDLKHAAKQYPVTAYRQKEHKTLVEEDWNTLWLKGAARFSNGTESTLEKQKNNNKGTE
ncbi:hypothetical protein Zmor_026932 [Zophobas morio]|uniref:Uncharacterized protein n=1 Tax=Zophobas morio TaxID=2755281 RepID=A0AA38HVP1_9CUCU|nr:hypothetical protein Zmor_026932 [Zophobas morio]